MTERKLFGIDVSPDVYEANRHLAKQRPVDKTQAYARQRVCRGFAKYNQATLMGYRVIRIPTNMATAQYLQRIVEAVNS